MLRGHWVVGVACIAALAFAGPAQADADGCKDSDRYTRFDIGGDTINQQTLSVPTDGVIPFATQRGEGLWSDEETFDAIAVEVSGDAGDVGGRLAIASGVIVWRPDQPLTEDENYIVYATVDNSSLDDRTDCAPDLLDPPFARIDVRGTSSPATADYPGFGSEVVAVDSSELDDWACCGGAMAELPAGCPAPVFDPADGVCLATAKRRLALAQFVPPLGGLTFENPARIMQDNTKLELLVDGRVVASALGWDDEGGVGFAAAEDFEAQLRVTSLIDGSESTTDTFQVEEDFGGDEPFDALPILSSLCQDDEPYHCVVVDTPDGQAWDPDLCSPWPSPLPTPPVESTGGEEETGTSSGTGSTGEDTQASSSRSTGAEMTSGDAGSATPQDDDGGCGCRPVAPPPSNSFWLLGVLLLRRRAPKSL